MVSIQLYVLTAAKIWKYQT